MSHEFLTPQQILDRAIEYNDGIVNFRMLYTLLHILVNNICGGMDTYRIDLCTNANEANEKERDCTKKQIPKQVVVLIENLVGEDGPKKGGITVLNEGVTTDLVKESRSDSSMATIDGDATKALVEEKKADEVDLGVSSKLDGKKDENNINCEGRLSELENVIKNLTTIVNDLTRNFHLFETRFIKNEEITRVKNKLDEVEKEFREKHGFGSGSRNSLSHIKTNAPTENAGSVSSPTQQASNATKETTKVEDCTKLDTLLKDVTKLKDDFKKLKSGDIRLRGSPEAKVAATIDEPRLKAIEAKLSQFETIFETLEVDKKGRKSEPEPSPKSTENLDAVQSNINTIKNELEKLGDLSGLLLSEKDSVAKQLEKISTQIQTIKDEKADKDDVREALMDKADYNTIQNKVSQEELTATKCDMSKHISDLINSLTEKEDAWKQTIKDIQRLLGSKMDHHDIAPLKAYIKTQIDHLQGQLRGLEQMKEETEAAGTRSKVLRNVNCVSCDVSAVMRRVDPCQGITKLDSLRPIISLKPYLCYKMDAMKHEHHHAKSSYRMCEQKPIGGAIYDSNYLCNRYCGGHHTKFNIYDRVSKCAFLRPCCNYKRY